MAEKEYIERKAAMKAILGQPPEPHYPEWYYRNIKELPAADVVEVVHGEWIIKSEIHKMFDDVDEEMYVECPFCKRTYYVPQTYDEEEIIAYAREQYPFCNCGAKMDGERKEQE
jgi:hypothetical protein